MEADIFFRGLPEVSQKKTPLILRGEGRAREGDYHIFVVTNECARECEKFCRSIAKLGPFWQNKTEEEKISNKDPCLKSIEKKNKRKAETRGEIVRRRRGIFFLYDQFS